MLKMPDAQLAALIQEMLGTTGQPVVVFEAGGELQIGVLEGTPDSVDWYFSPVPAAVAEQELGVKECRE